MNRKSARQAGGRWVEHFSAHLYSSNKSNGYGIPGLEPVQEGTLKKSACKMIGCLLESAPESPLSFNDVRALA